MKTTPFLGILAMVVAAMAQIDCHNQYEPNLTFLSIFPFYNSVKRNLPTN